MNKCIFLLPLCAIFLLTNSAFAKQYAFLTHPPSTRFQTTRQPIIPGPGCCTIHIPQGPTGAVFGGFNLVLELAGIGMGIGSLVQRKRPGVSLALGITGLSLFGGGTLLHLIFLGIDPPKSDQVGYITAHTSALVLSAVSLVVNIVALAKRGHSTSNTEFENCAQIQSNYQRYMAQARATKSIEYRETLSGYLSNLERRYPSCFTSQSGKALRQERKQWQTKQRKNNAPPSRPPPPGKPLSQTKARTKTTLIRTEF